MTNEKLQDLTFNTDGLIPAIIQDDQSNRVIMFAWMNLESLEKTILIGETVFFSRSRNELWHKGATSGNTQKVSSIQVDCDSDALLIRVHPHGAACHTGLTSCFDTSKIEVNA
jgi:phosphoribosyl-ATP pyrophosphohydrolase/phosphoribosyl-AMP cyclohydrolase